MMNEGVAECPRCEGKGKTKFTRKGGWLIETCTVCDGRGTVDVATALVVVGLIEMGEARKP